MLGYISSTRKKSCYGCVKAKRRCTLGYPFCKRCSDKGLDCSYPNARRRVPSLRDAEVVIRQTTPDISLPSLQFCDAPPISNSAGFVVDLNAPVDDDNAQGDPLALFHSVALSGACGSRQLAAVDDGHGYNFSFNNFSFNNFGDDGWNNDWLHGSTSRSSIGRTLLPEIWAPAHLNNGQVQAVIRGLRSLVPDLARNGSTHFVHHNLYHAHPPEAYLDCVALSTMYTFNNERTQTHLANSIRYKIAALKTASPTWSLKQHLAAVQALLIYQIIRLFDPALNLEIEAEKENALLQSWSTKLWNRFLSGLSEELISADSYNDFVFKESLRRTVLMSVFMRCGWSIMTRGGIADDVPTLSRLPITRDLEAWTCDSERWNGSVRPRLKDRETLVSYGGWSTGWSRERRVEELDPFGKLLLAACRGGEDPRLLV